MFYSPGVHCRWHMRKQKFLYDFPSDPHTGASLTEHLQRFGWHTALIAAIVAINVKKKSSCLIVIALDFSFPSGQWYATQLKLDDVTEWWMENQCWFLSISKSMPRHEPVCNASITYEVRISVAVIAYLQNHEHLKELIISQWDCVILILERSRRSIALMTMSFRFLSF